MGSDSKLLTSLFCLRVSEDMTWCVVGKLIEMPFIFRPRTHGMDKGSNYKTHTHKLFVSFFACCDGYFFFRTRQHDFMLRKLPLFFIEILKSSWVINLGVTMVNTIKTILH